MVEAHENDEPAAQVHQTWAPPAQRSVSEYDQTVSAASFFAGDSAADTSATNEPLVAGRPIPLDCRASVPSLGTAGSPKSPTLVRR
jgi:hypothetical protein